ncbi:hypothetical protein O6H91_19G076300 [Diphasiastrum complanatum]|uniref:Uncharacterized protein n=4 Tax=Diphasiastrum complanatum TaxID=34168 RepID=A0ACC2AWV4_DIPCM|nr:hypothetical protein O6H91_19G076300 [Diphasiastrum complanatum]
MARSSISLRCRKPQILLCICGVHVLMMMIMMMLILPGLPAHSCVFPEFSHQKEDATKWLQSRVSNLPQKKMLKKNWPTHGKFGLQSPEFKHEEFFAKHALFEELANSLRRDGYLSTQRDFFAFIHLDTLGNTQTKADHGWTLVAKKELESGTTLMSFPLGLCMSDAIANEDPISLMGAPWEIQLATKLLRERAKGVLSHWSLYIRTLPRFIALPIFFSNMELKNLQDTWIKDEVLSIRKFLLDSFQALQHEETAGAKFSEFAWAVSVVYSSACEMKQVLNQRMVPSLKHLLIPIYSSFPKSKTAVPANSWNISKGMFNFMVNNEIKEGTLLATHAEPNSVTDAFLFQGYVPQSKLQDRARIFKNVEEFVDWYSSAYSAVNNNRYLTFKVANDAIDTLKRHRHSLLLETSMEDLSVGANGYVDPHLVCAIATLYSAKELIKLSNSNMVDEVEFSPSDFDNKEGTLWETMLLRLANDSLSINVWNLPVSLEMGGALLLKQAFSFAAQAIQQRINLILGSYSTDLKEDNLLLHAAAQEGLNYDDTNQACPNCRWQTEELSGNDHLAVKFRVYQKVIFQHVLSFSKNKNGIYTSEESSSLREKEDKNSESLQKFLNWCNEHEFKISGKLAITNIASGEDEYSPEGHTSLVRGIVATENINHGETLCILKLAAGLYDNESSSDTEVDDWDLAAALLLREKALGDNSRWAPYIAILPTDMPTPITMESNELEEVQWWPAVRELIQIRQAIKKSYHLLDRQDVAWASFKEYRWAATMIHSRAFTLPVLDDEKYSHYVMMPYMDMINHHFHYQADWISQPIVDGKLEIVARRHLKKGEQLFASFGPRSNDNLFLYYGFILDNNPFDSAKIFPSFNDGVRWFLQVWTTDCIHLAQNTTSYEVCDFHRWQTFLPKTMAALEDFSSGALGQSKDWWELVERWSEYGSQYVPYQPNPTVYASGVTDPSLLTAFISLANVTISSRMPNLNGLISCEADDCKNQTFVRSNMKKFFRCMQSLENPFYRPLLHQHDCQNFLASVLRAQEQKVWTILVARISVALRCLELLASFPTTITEDHLLLKNSTKSRGSNQPNGKTFTTVDVISPSVHLARHYRYAKKLLLRSTVDRVLAF